MSACRQAKDKYIQECCEMGDEHTLMKGKIVSVHERTPAQANLPKLKGIHTIYGTPWNRVYCDESHKFANPVTKTYKCMMAIYGKYKWCLSGSPIKNYDTDIWAQLRFCGYDGVTEANKWKKKGPTVFKEHGLINAVMTMDYKDAGIKLPPKTENLINIKLTGMQKKAYDFILGIARDVYDKMMQNLCSFSCVLAMFTRLRQCAIAPYLITAESKREKAKGAKAKGDKEAVEILKKMSQNELGKWCHDKNGEAGIRSAKITEIINILKRIKKPQKVIIFSMFVSCLDLLADAIETFIPDMGVVQIDGDTDGPDRDLLIKQLNRDKNTRVGMFTYKVGSEGLNLTCATHVIPIEPWWTPVVPNQAKSRAWRKGQTEEVHIHNIIIQESIEERVVEICNEKDEMASSYLEGTVKSVEKEAGLNKYTLGRILNM